MEEGESKVKQVLSTLWSYLYSSLPPNEDFIIQLQIDGIIERNDATKLRASARLGGRACIHDLITFMYDFFDESALETFCTFLDKYGQPARHLMLKVATKIREEIGLKLQPVHELAPEDPQNGTSRARADVAHTVPRTSVPATFPPGSSPPESLAPYTPAPTKATTSELSNKVFSDEDAASRLGIAVAALDLSEVTSQQTYTDAYLAKDPPHRRVVTAFFCLQSRLASIFNKHCDIAELKLFLHLRQKNEEWPFKELEVEDIDSMKDIRTIFGKICIDWLNTEAFIRLIDVLPDKKSRDDAKQHLEVYHKQLGVFSKCVLLSHIPKDDARLEHFHSCMFPKLRVTYDINMEDFKVSKLLKQVNFLSRTFCIPKEAFHYLIGQCGSTLVTWALAISMDKASKLFQRVTHEFWSLKEHLIIKVEIESDGIFQLHMHMKGRNSNLHYQLKKALQGNQDLLLCTEHVSRQFLALVDYSHLKRIVTEPRLQPALKSVLQPSGPSNVAESETQRQARTGDESQTVPAVTAVTAGVTRSGSVRRSRSDKPLKDMGWYWGDISRAEVNVRLKNAEDGTFLVRNSSNTSDEYTLTVKKDGSNRLVRVIKQDDRYGFAVPTKFESVPALVEFFQTYSLVNYNKKLDIILSHPLSRFPIDEESEDEEDEQEAELWKHLEEVSIRFNEANTKYKELEKDEGYVMDLVEVTNAKLVAQESVLKLLTEQTEIFKVEVLPTVTDLNASDTQMIRQNWDALATRLNACKALCQKYQTENHMAKINYRNIDCELNTMRPDLMKVQREKNHLVLLLQKRGHSQKNINKRIQDHADNEAEDIYGCLYGGLGDTTYSAAAYSTFNQYEERNEYISLPSSSPVTTPDPAPVDYHPPKVPPFNKDPGRDPPLPVGKRPSRGAADPQPLFPPPPESPVPPSSSSASRESSVVSPVARPVPKPRALSQRLRSVDKLEPRDSWYREVDRVEEDRLLASRPDGTFLVRPAGRNRAHKYTLALKFGKVRRLQIYENYYGRCSFSPSAAVHSSLEEFIRHYTQNSLETHNKELTTRLEYTCWGGQ